MTSMARIFLYIMKVKKNIIVNVNIYTYLCCRKQIITVGEKLAGRHKLLRIKTQPKIAEVTKNGEKCEVTTFPVGNKSPLEVAENQSSQLYYKYLQLRVWAIFFSESDE